MYTGRRCSNGPLYSIQCVGCRLLNIRKVDLSLNRSHCLDKQGTNGLAFASKRATSDSLRLPALSFGFGFN